MKNVIVDFIQVIKKHMSKFRKREKIETEKRERKRKREKERER